MRQVAGTAVHVGRDVAVEAGHPAELDLLADDDREVGDGLRHGLAVGQRRRARLLGVGGRDLVGELGQLLGQGDELLVLGHEVGLGVELDDGGAVVGDQSGRRLALGAALGGLRRAGDAQDLDRLVEVAVGLGERLLGVHHPGAGGVAELLDVGCCDASWGSKTSMSRSVVAGSDFAPAAVKPAASADSTVSNQTSATVLVVPAAAPAWWYLPDWALPLMVKPSGASPFSSAAWSPGRAGRRRPAQPREPSPRPDRPRPSRRARPPRPGPQPSRQPEPPRQAPRRRPWPEPLAAFFAERPASRRPVRPRARRPEPRRR